MQELLQRFAIYPEIFQTVTQTEDGIYPWWEWMYRYTYKYS
jgi:hypothetical protein